MAMDDVLGDFQRFVGKGCDQTPAVSITKSGKLGFNKTLVRKYNIADFDFIILFYNRKEKEVLIHLTNDKKEEGKFKIGKYRAGFSVAVASFFKHIFYDYEQGLTKYGANETDIENSFTIKLQD